MICKNKKTWHLKKIHQIFNSCVFHLCIFFWPIILFQSEASIKLYHSVKLVFFPHFSRWNVICPKPFRDHLTQIWQQLFSDHFDFWVSGNSRCQRFTESLDLCNSTPQCIIIREFTKFNEHAPSSWVVRLNPTEIIFYCWNSFSHHLRMPQIPILPISSKPRREICCQNDWHYVLCEHLYSVLWIDTLSHHEHLMSWFYFFTKNILFFIII